MMNKLAEDTIQFFSAKESYFWRWSEHADIIEWQDGTTICYREEIISILRKINTFEIIPPFGSVLLILSACQENWADSDISKDILSSILKLVIENNAPKTPKPQESRSDKIKLSNKARVSQRYIIIYFTHTV